MAPPPRSGSGGDPVGGVDEADDFRRANAFVEDACGAAVHLQRHRLGLGQEGQFGGGFDHAAAVNDGAGVDQGDVGGVATDAVDEEEGEGGVDGERGGVRGAQGVGDQGGGTFILFP